MATPATSAVELLVVEDHKDLADILGHVLRRAGYQVHLVRSGRDAEDLVRSRPAMAVAVLDVGLPYKDGFQLIQEIRASDIWKAVPIIMLSGRNSREDLARARALGANDYVIKPFQPPELLARIRALVAEPARGRLQPAAPGLADS